MNTVVTHRDGFNPLPALQFVTKQFSSNVLEYKDYTSKITKVTRFLQDLYMWAEELTPETIKLAHKEVMLTDEISLFVSLKKDIDNAYEYQDSRTKTITNLLHGRIVNKLNYITKKLGYKINLPGIYQYCRI